MNFENSKLQFYVDIVRYLDNKYKDSTIRVEGEYIRFDNLLASLEPAGQNKIIIHVECLKTGVVVREEVLWFNMNNDISVIFTELLKTLRDKQMKLSNEIKSTIGEMLDSIYTGTEPKDVTVESSWYVSGTATINLHKTDVEQIRLGLVILDNGYNEILIEKVYPVKGLTPNIIALSVIKSFQDDINILSV